MEPVGDEHKLCAPAAHALQQLIQTSQSQAPFTDDHDDKRGIASVAMRNMGTGVSGGGKPSQPWFRDVFKNDSSD